MKPPLALAISVAFGVGSCTPAAPLRHIETMAMSGPAPACGDVFAARLDASRKRALVLDLDLEDDPLPINSSRTLSIAEMNQGKPPAVRMEDWSNEVFASVYCSDVGHGPRPVDTWRAIEGSVTISRMALPPHMFRARVPQMYLVKAHGEGLVFVNKRGDMRKVHVWDVPVARVGWEPP